MQARLQFVEQVSDRPEQCTRCERLHRKETIRVGERHWAMIDSTEALDAPPRIVLCEACRRFLRHAAAK